MDGFFRPAVVILYDEESCLLYATHRLRDLSEDGC